jgi:chromate transporter
MKSPEATRTADAATAAHPSFGEALRFWLRLGFISFGGPTGQIAIMHTELVERRRWTQTHGFLRSACVLPGPKANQLILRLAVAPPGRDSGRRPLYPTVLFSYGG